MSQLTRWIRLTFWLLPPLSLRFRRRCTGCGPLAGPFRGFAIERIQQQNQITPIVPPKTRLRREPFRCILKFELFWIFQELNFCFRHRGKQFRCNANQQINCTCPNTKSIEIVYYQPEIRSDFFQTE